VEALFYATTEVVARGKKVIHPPMFYRTDKY